MLEWSAIPTCPDFHTPSVRLENATSQPCSGSEPTGQLQNTKSTKNTKTYIVCTMKQFTLTAHTPTQAGYPVQWAGTAGTPTTLPGAIWLGKLMFCKNGANNLGLGCRLRCFIFYTSPKTPVAYHRYRIDVSACF